MCGPLTKKVPYISSVCATLVSSIERVKIPFLLQTIILSKKENEWLLLYHGMSR